MKVEFVAEAVVALEAQSMMAELEGSRHLRAVVGSEKVGVLPKVTVLGTVLEVVPGAALEAAAKNWELSAVVLAVELHPKMSQEKIQAAELNSYDHLPPELLLAEAAVEIQALGESMWVVLPLCWQELPGAQEGERALRQVQGQGLARVLEQELPLRWGLQQVWIDYFQHTEACPGLLLPSVGTKEDSWG